MTALRRRLKKVVVREVEGEILLLDTGANLIHQLNETASFVWRRCDAAASPASIARELAREYDVDEQEALDDVIRTLETFRSLNLVAENDESM